MVKLTEDMIVARTRVSDMGHVKKLNCWGAELTDISVLRKLKNVEVLSLSVNSISTLEDISYCSNLQELYIRKNKVPDISEICWLKDLPRLKNVWLEENPCSEGGAELYRLTVIKTLPQLQKLDNSQVTSEEMADAMRRGLDLMHPLDGGGAVNAMVQDDRKTSRGHPQSYDQDFEHTGRRESVQSPSRRVSNQIFEEQRISYSQSPVQRYPEEDMRRMSIREEGRYSEEPPYRPQRSSYSGPSPDGYRVDGNRGLDARGPYNQSYQEYQELSQSEQMHAVVNRHYNSTYRQVDQQLDSAQQLLGQRGSPQSRPYPVRPKNRNSNVLSAILCLIKEVDGPSLEVVEMAVRCRMEELED